jgi:hypothetical protein
VSLPRLVPVLLLIAAAGCRKPKPAASAPDAGGVTCPSSDALAAMVREPGRTLHVGCLAYAPAYFWTAAALSYETQSRGQVRLQLLSGGPGMGTSLFDVAPIPTDSVEELIRGTTQLEVVVRKPHGAQLVRLGVVGRKGAPPRVQSEEIVVLLRLQAHGPPAIVWVGGGDTVTLNEGCLHERTVEFELPFKTRLEMTSSARSRPVEGRPCPPPSSLQEPLSMKALPLAKGRTLPP